MHLQCTLYIYPNTIDMILSIVVHICCATVALSYTREFRTLQLDLPSCANPMGIADPTIYGFSDAVNIACGKLLEQDKIHEIRDDLNNLIDGAIRDAGNAYKSEDDLSWLQNCDNHTIHSVNVHMSTKKKWRGILWSKRTSPVTVVELQDSLSGVMQFENELSFSLEGVAMALSSKRYFDIATMVCYPYIVHLLESGWQGDMDSIILALNVMAEGHRHMGQLELATLYSLKVPPPLLPHVNDVLVLMLCIWLHSW